MRAPVSAEQYIAGVDIMGCVRESSERRLVREVIAPFIQAEGAKGADAHMIELVLVRVGVDVTDWDRAFIFQSVVTQPSPRLFSGPRRRGPDRPIGAEPWEVRNLVIDTVMKDLREGGAIDRALSRAFALETKSYEPSQ